RAADPLLLMAGEVCMTMHILLSPEPIHWGFDNHQGNITFELVVNTTGWVGFGFSPNGGMKGSDIVIGGIGPTGNYFAVRQYQKKCMCSSLCCYRL
uniref:DOMON domain-containing protein n=1 Tax=Takifugu rubripes TaxID=31033 RepID=A0A674MZN7_TAKRU